MLLLLRVDQLDPDTFIISYLMLNRSICIIIWDGSPPDLIGGRRSPAVACWASDHWVARSNPLRGNFCH